MNFEIYIFFIVKKVIPVAILAQATPATQTRNNPSWEPTFQWWVTEFALDISGQIIATSHDLTPNGGLVKGNPLISGKPGWEQLFSEVSLGEEASVKDTMTPSGRCTRYL